MLKFTLGLMGLCLLAVAARPVPPAAAQAPKATMSPSRTAAAADIPASLRDHNSDGPWQSVDLAAGANGSVPVCLPMTLGVGSIDYKVADGSGAALCDGDKLVPQGGSVTLSVADGGACTI